MKYVGTYSENQDIVTKEKIENSVEYKEVAKSLPAGNYDVVYGGDKFVALDISYDYANAVYSTDGIHWEEATLPIDAAEEVSNIVYGNGKFAIICKITRTTSYVVYSSDGINWAKSAMPEFNGKYSAIAYADDRFVVVGGNTANEYGVKVVTSTDLINWTTVTTSGLDNKNNIQSLAYGAGKLVAGSLNTSTYYCTSPNFDTWSSIRNMARLDKIVYGNDLFVGVNAIDGYVGSATNSFTSWNVKSTPYDFEFYDLVYGDGKFVALTSSEQNGILYSEDGTNWSEYAIPRQQSNSSWLSIAYGGGKFVAIDNHGIVALSADGKNWEIPKTKLLQYPDGTNITSDIKEALGVPTSYVSSVNGKTGDVTIDDAVSTTTDTDIAGLLKGENGKVAKAEPNVDYATMEYISILDGYVTNRRELYFAAGGSILDGSLTVPQDDNFQAVCYSWLEYMLTVSSGDDPTAEKPVLLCDLNTGFDDVVKLHLSGYKKDQWVVFSGIYDNDNQEQYAISVVYNVDKNTFVQIECKTLPSASSTTPKAAGTANAGSEDAYARGDHVHPKQSVSKSDVGLGNVDNVSINARLNRTTNVNAADANYTTYMARGESLNASEVTPTVNGCIAWVFG